MAARQVDAALRRELDAIGMLRGVMSDEVERRQARAQRPGR